MKLTLEKDEIQLLGQLVVEILNGAFPTQMMLQAVILWEFKVENAEVFEHPTRIKRKLKLSTIIAIKTYLWRQPQRNDTYWDLTLNGLRDKLDRISAIPSNQNNPLKIG